MLLAVSINQLAMTSQAGCCMYGLVYLDTLNRAVVTYLHPTQLVNMVCTNGIEHFSMRVGYRQYRGARHKGRFGA